MNINNHCIFCIEKYSESLLENEDWYVAPDQNPVSNGHLLVIPKLHITTFVQLTIDQWASLNQIIYKSIQLLQQLDSENLIAGWNYGWNEGVAGGQTVEHFHFHIIPRRTKDNPNPGGGIRGAIPERQNPKILQEMKTNKLSENIFDRLIN